MDCKAIRQEQFVKKGMFNIPFLVCNNPIEWVDRNPVFFSIFIAFRAGKGKDVKWFFCIRTKSNQKSIICNLFKIGREFDDSHRIGKQESTAFDVLQC